MLGDESWGKRTVVGVHLEDIFNIQALGGIFRAVLIIEGHAV